MGLDDARAALRATRYELVAQIEQIDQALAVLGEAGGGSDQKMARPTPTKKSAAKPAAGGFVCETCGRRFESAGGIAVHRARAHGKNWNSRPPASADEAERFADAVGEATSKNPRMALHCEECEWSTTNLDRQAINKHTLAEHNRIAKPSERVPRRDVGVAV